MTLIVFGVILLLALLTGWLLLSEAWSDAKRRTDIQLHQFNEAHPPTLRRIK
jgi:hypothetical protein